MNGKRVDLTLAVALLLVALAAGAFIAGRATARDHTPASYRAGYLAGREDAFGDYDGGWGYGEPYIVVLRRASRRSPTRSRSDGRWSRGSSTAPAERASAAAASADSGVWQTGRSW